MKIVYATNTGHTYKYAQLLGKKLNAEVLPVSKIKEVERDTEIIYISWVLASTLRKIKKVMRDYNVVSVVAVGMSPKSDGNTKTLIDRNKISVPFFYLQGGIDYSKLKGIKRLMLKMVGRMVIKENKPEDKEIIEIFKNGGNFVSEKNLTDIVSYFSAKKNRNNIA